MRLIVATHNQHKLKEIKDYLIGYDFEIVGLSEVNFDFEIEENKDTYIDNALLKARTILSFYPDDMILADDSGFSVQALNNQPGVHSARFLGVDTPAHVKNQHILKMLEGQTNRKAMFTCAMVLVHKMDEFVTQQVVYGSVSKEMLGSGSFGYDPIFIPAGHDKTFAQDLEYKALVSHRSKALLEVLKYVQYLQK